MSDPNQQFHAPTPPSIQPEPERRRPGYLMWAGVALVIVGIVVVVLGIPGIALIVGGIGTGAAVCGLGVLLFAFSFIRMPVVDNPPPRMSAIGTLTGIFFEPTGVFRNLRAHPQFLAAILLAGAINGAYSVAFTHRRRAIKLFNPNSRIRMQASLA